MEKDRQLKRPHLQLLAKATALSCKVIMHSDLPRPVASDLILKRSPGDVTYLEVVVEGAVKGEAHGIDGEVAPGGVQLPVVHKLHHRVAAVGDPVHAKCCDLRQDMSKSALTGGGA